MKRKSYLQTHQNKKPKKAKYSKYYSKLQLQMIREMEEYFINEIKKMKL